MRDVVEGEALAGGGKDDVPKDAAIDEPVVKYTRAEMLGETLYDWGLLEGLVGNEVGVTEGKVVVFREDFCGRGFATCDAAGEADVQRVWASH